jgi:hypothetical protein
MGLIIPKNRQLELNLELIILDFLYESNINVDDNPICFTTFA